MVFSFIYGNILKALILNYSIDIALETKKARLWTELLNKTTLLFFNFKAERRECNDPNTNYTLKVVHS